LDGGDEVDLDFVEFDDRRDEGGGKAGGGEAALEVGAEGEGAGGEMRGGEEGEEVEALAGPGGGEF